MIPLINHDSSEVVIIYLDECGKQNITKNGLVIKSSPNGSCFLLGESRIITGCEISVGATSALSKT